MRTLTFVFLILGLLCSIFIRIDFFSTNNIFEYRLVASPHFSFADIAFNSSVEKTFSSQIISTVFYLLSVLSIFLDKKRKSISLDNFLFMGLVSFQLLYDFFCIYKVSINEYEGEHLRIGLILFLLGIFVWKKM